MASPARRRRRPSPGISWWRSSSACPHWPRWPAPLPRAPLSAVSSKNAPFAAASARSTGLPSSASWARPASTPPRRRTPLPRSPAPSPRAPRISPSSRPSFLQLPTSLQLPVQLPTSLSGSCPATKNSPRWRPRDARDGRVLLDWVSLNPRFVQMWGNPEDGSDVSVLMDCNELADYDVGARATWIKRERCNAADFHLAVCDPLSCRYELLPTIPEDFAAKPGERLFEFVPMLAPATEDESFKVICMASYQTKLALFVFISTPTTRQWRMATFPILTPRGGLSCFDCVRGFFYWTKPFEWSDYLLVLDTRTMRFSYVDLLTGYHVQLRDLPDQSIGCWRPSAVVVGREAAIEMFSLVGQNRSFALYHTSLQNDSQEWKLEKIIPLPGQYKDYSISTVGAAEGFLFFRGAPEGIGNRNVDCYSLEVKTYEITKVCSKKELVFNPKHALPYFSFPKLLSEPSITVQRI